MIKPTHRHTKQKKNKTLWHVGGWNRNYGDFAIQAGMMSRLMAESPAPLQFVPIDCQRTRFHRALVETMNRDADLLLIGGGGMVFHRPEDQSQSGWQWNISFEDLNAIKIPVVVYGIGYNKFFYDSTDFKTEMNDHLAATQEKASLFSVRNHGTQQELIRRGLNDRKIECIPDAGMYAPACPITIPGLQTNRLIIGLNWAGDRIEQRWPYPAQETMEIHARALAKSLRRILDHHDGQCLFVSHIVGIDDTILPVLRPILEHRLLELERAIPEIYPPSVYQLPFLADAYRQCNMVIGMRGHANIVPFGQNVPVMGLGSHNKNKFFLEQIGQDQSRLAVHEGCSESWIESEYYNKIECMIQSLDGAKKTLKQKLLEHQNKTLAFHQKIIELLS